MWDKVSKEVRHPTDNSVIGRITFVKEDKPDAAVAVYCRLRQCSCPLKLAKHVLDTVQLRRWFQAGLDLGSGKQHREAHMRLYREMCANAKQTSKQ